MERISIAKLCIGIFKTQRKFAKQTIDFKDSDEKKTAPEWASFLELSEKNIWTDIEGEFTRNEYMKCFYVLANEFLHKSKDIDKKSLYTIPEWQKITGIEKIML